MDLSKWSIFSLLDADLLSTLSMVCVFGSGNEALVISNKDQVYTLGSNISGCLGLGDTNGILQPKKLEALSGKKVQGVACGSGPHVLVCTANGEIHSWGHNGYSQLGNGNTNAMMTPSVVGTNLVDKVVVQVACGSHHSMALTADGDVYAWGQNNCGQIGCNATNNNQTNPRRVTAVIGGKKVVSIVCGQTSSMAVLDNGEIYGWGYNGNGQIGVGTASNVSNPERVTNLQGVVIVEVMCGYAHTLALSDDGQLYAWGANSYGQLGTGNKTNLLAPQRIADEIGRVVEIGASHYNHISAAMTETSKVYMWGQCRGQSLTTPTETPFSSIHDVFACFASPAVTYRPIVLGTTSTEDPAITTSIKDNLRMAFDDISTSDMKFSIEGKLIHVHKAVLKIRCEHYRSMFQKHWEEDKKEVVEIEHYRYPVYRAFLRYLYTDVVNLEPNDAIGLLDLANAYCEPQLKRHCELIIRRGITVENAATLYAAAIRHIAKELEDFCFRFLVNHLTAVAQTPSFLTLDETTIKNFIVKAAKQGAFKY